MVKTSRRLLRICSTLGLTREAWGRRGQGTTRRASVPVIRGDYHNFARRLRRKHGPPMRGPLRTTNGIGWWWRVAKGKQMFTPVEQLINGSLIKNLVSIKPFWKRLAPLPERRRCGGKTNEPMTNGAESDSK